MLGSSEPNNLSLQKALMATLLMTLLVSGSLFYFWDDLQGQKQQRLQDLFKTDVAEVATKIADRMTSYALILKGVRGLFLSSQKVSRQEWHTYVSSLEMNDDYPGIQGVGYAVSISPASLAAHEQEINSEGFDNYHIWPEGKRDVYTGIVYLEPFDWRNQRAFGYDMFSESTRREAMMLARDTGIPALTGKVLLVQETHEAPQAGTLRYVAVYRKEAPLETVEQRRQALQGWVYSPYRMDNLIKGMLGKHTSDLHLRIYDQNGVNSEDILYDSSASEERDPDTILFHQKLHLDIGGRTWLLSFDALPTYAQLIGDDVLFEEMTGAILIGLLLIVLTWNMFNTQRKAYFLAQSLNTSLHESEAMFRSIIESSPLPIALNDEQQNITLLNQKFIDIFGYTQSDIPTLAKWRLRAYPNPDYRQHVVQAWQAAVEKALQNNTVFEPMEYKVTCKDGSVRDIEFNMAPVGTTSIVIFHDLTDRKAAEERIDRLAHFDHLTGLPNRVLLHDRCKYLISLAQRNRKPLAVLFLDLDGFKNINDSLGHAVGDMVLMRMAALIKDILREEDTVARLGGDEFILLLPDADADGAAQVASKLLEFISQPLQIGIHELTSTASIGITIYPDDGKDLEALLKNSDSAMYSAKQGGRNNFCFFTPEMQEDSTRRLQLSSALRHALENNELHLHYQPQASMLDGHVLGVEALLRWNHPELGMISPAEFIPIAEESGQIIPIGEWVLRTATSQLKAWLDKGLPPMLMAVNLSAIQFGHANVVSMVTDILDKAELPYEYLELELTEAAAMDDPYGAIKVMNELHAHGIRMSIDDFGTGYSSLSYLKKFKVYKLKIDQSFVRDLIDDLDDQAIVTTIIKMAQSLGMQTIAEGVETEGQLNFLRSQGCNEMQGYYFSKPLTAEQLEAFVKAD